MCHNDDDRELLGFIKYGFPLGYMGPMSDTVTVPNHPSATDYLAEVSKFVASELKQGAVYGPFLDPPFREWIHISPLMTRPKSDSCDRRIIMDMSYPRDKSVNAYIAKNTIFGKARDHSLPTVDRLLQDIYRIGKGAVMFTLDVARAYKNFRSCPLDWPLLAFRWAGAIFLDTAMPFGARVSSNHMQRVATMITSILQRRGITCHMYLDDLIVVAESMSAANEAYNITRELFEELGLPEAAHKTQPPNTRVKWLGIIINTADMTISIPENKIKQTLAEIERIRSKRSITIKTLQSILGRIHHISKCVTPARLFVGRLLTTLREAKGWYIRINKAMRLDFDWFTEYLPTWNGVALITSNKEIVADACTTGVGAADGYRYYSEPIPQFLSSLHISSVESVNVLIAIRTFITEADVGTTVSVRCDNKPAIDVYRSGRGRDPVLLACARAIWLIQAQKQVRLVFIYTPGVNMQLADTLSRAPAECKFRYLVSDLTRRHKLVRCYPDLSTAIFGEQIFLVTDPAKDQLIRAALSSQRESRAPGTVANHKTAVHTYLASLQVCSGSQLPVSTRLVCVC